MLPLWIIDITKKSDRRDVFLHLVGKMEHVFIPDALKNTENAETTDAADSTNISPADKKSESVTKSDVTDNILPVEKGMGEADSVRSRTIEEELDEDERENAARQAVIHGDYWYYSAFDHDTYFEGLDINDHDCIKNVAEKLYDFQEAIVSAGKDFIMTLRKSNVRPYQPINIAVLGDVTEDLTRMVFSSIAAILQKEKGRFLPAHIHQGMSVYGMLYVPCDVNTYKVSERNTILRLLNEIEVQHHITAIRGYDHMMLYQNVQNRTECTYSLLSEEQQAEYLLQCIVHLFLACDINHPLISGTSSDDTFYFSMGATSVFFDMTIEDENDAENVACSIINYFKEDGDNENVEQDINLLDKSLYTADLFVKTIKVENFDLENEARPEVRPHPIHDFLYKYLKKQYYLFRLRFFPAELLRDILKRIEEGTSARLDEISAYCVRSFKSAQITILPAIARILSKVNEHDGALSFIENRFKDQEEHLSKEKEDVQRSIERNFWHKIMYETQIIPKNQKDPFEQYHEAYVGDIQTKNSGAGCKSMRDEVLANLKGLLSKERTLLATLTRCFLLGLMFVLGLLPVLDFISPNFIDLGNVYDNAFLWAIGLFLIPLLIQYVAFLLYMRKRAQLIRILKAYYLHDAYARLANRIESEATDFYNKMIDLCEEYIERCKRIRREVRFPMPKPDQKMLFPVSMFNQPLSGGVFNGEELIPATEIEGSRIRVNYTPRYINELTKSNYFQLINHFNDELAMLFSGVSLIDYHARRFDEKKGDYVFVSRDEVIAKNQQEWEEIKNKCQITLMKVIKDEMVPREYPTVGEKLIQYKKKINKLTLLEPMLAYAATNGEVTSEADIEYADVKVNREIDDLLIRYLPLYTTRTQVSKYDELYQKYIFVTRWRCFGHFSYNRIFPKEDFDQMIREERIFQDEQRAKENKKRKNEKLYAGKLKDEDLQSMKEEKPYILHTSSLILWAVCPNDNSSEWLNLFEAEHFSEAYNDRNTYREFLNKND